MKGIKILWADDEIDLLKIQIVFLEKKGFVVSTATNGADAVDMVNDADFDIIFLDENMPGLSGLETLTQIKALKPAIPVIMITKSEEEDIMDQAIGSKIADYLIKPVNPNQILLSIKKNIDNKRLITEKTTSNYQSEFGKLGFQINDCRSFVDWIEVYKKLVYWELELENSGDSTMDEVLKMQKNEANSGFCKYIKANYLSWFDPANSDKPLLSPSLVKHSIYPLLKEKQKVFFIIIDNLRYDQWKIVESEIRDYFITDKEEIYTSILPTCTQYSRNAIFSGLMPSEIENMYPELWLNDDQEGSKNMHEQEMLENQLKRLGIQGKTVFEKIQNNRQGKKIVDNIKNLLNQDFITIVYNFIDMLSHARTEMDMIRELAGDESAFRSLTKSWLQHSSLLELIKSLQGTGVSIVLTTDHGTIKVNNALKVVGDRKTTTNLRYKQGKNLAYNKKEVFEITNPKFAGLPLANLSSTYIFAMNDDFFAYPNNFHHYVKYYKDTFQHGGISLEEMLIPLVTLKSK